MLGSTGAWSLELGYDGAGRRGSGAWRLTVGITSLQVFVRSVIFQFRLIRIQFPPLLTHQIMALDIRTAELKKPIDIAEYLFRRLHEVGVRGVHGVPGDYNLVRLSVPRQRGVQFSVHAVRLRWTIYQRSA